MLASVAAMRGPGGRPSTAAGTAGSTPAGGATGPPGSSARRSASAVEPVRGRPRPMSGATVGSVGDLGVAAVSVLELQGGSPAAGRSAAAARFRRRSFSVASVVIERSRRSRPPRNGVVAEVVQLPRVCSAAAQQRSLPWRFVAAITAPNRRGERVKGRRCRSDQLHQPGEGGDRLLRFEAPAPHQVLVGRQVPEQVEHGRHGVAAGSSTPSSAMTCRNAARRRCCSTASKVGPSGRPVRSRRWGTATAS